MAASWSLAASVRAAVRPLTSRQAVGCGDPLLNYDAPQFARGLRERVEHRRNSIIVGAAAMRIALFGTPTRSSFSHTVVQTDRAP